MNSLFYDIKNKHIVGLVGGVDDIKRGIDALKSLFNKYRKYSTDLTKFNVEYTYNNFMIEYFVNLIQIKNNIIKPKIVELHNKLLKLGWKYGDPKFDNYGYVLINSEIVLKFLDFAAITQLSSDSDTQSEDNNINTILNNNLINLTDQFQTFTDYFKGHNIINDPFISSNINNSILNILRKSYEEMCLQINADIS
jgi:hypothetical protein